jgi:hypothetical protein
MTVSADAAALLAWMDDAHHAVDIGHCLTQEMCLALVATPTTAAGTFPPSARTWFLEEYEREMRVQLRDPVPMAGSTLDVSRWRERQVQRSDYLAELLHLHTSCLSAARRFVGREQVSTPRETARRTPSRSSRRAHLDAVANLVRSLPTPDAA